ncbi:nucleoside triphosphate hydrolase [Peribacillus cavernae]|uniref:Nucleoside triphosphate hydrolase n=1 Tax=Peribacillus cavernae TaxID=1674310 RepID=A0A3S0TUC9_9BACI|nr:YhaN family protein [Peribacillus cavernae]MDQ0217663.1 uncharacterized protein YhaN [Peribacillus cavernae]RUQ28138.1 nucleoside triphosphate hydrolase [Peribacillus cavernae]
MRFDYFRLKAFGHFTDYHLTFDLNKNFHLIYGPNEAGKSTILNSVSNWLYGFPKNTTYSFLHDNKQLRIEGGLSRSTGEKLHFARRKGNKNTVLDLQDKPIDEQKVRQLLNHISEQQFTNMFALDHVRIREGGNSLLQSGGNLGESLFSAASGINMVRSVLDKLDTKAKDIYKKGGSNPPVNQLIKEEKELTKKITESQLRVKEWKDLEKSYREGEKHLEDLQKQIRELQTKQRKLLRVQTTLPKTAKRSEYKKKLEEVGSIPELPHDIRDRYNGNLQALQVAKKDLKKAEEQIEELQMELAKIQIPEFIIEHALLIDSLYKDVQSYENKLKKQPLLEQEKNLLEQQALYLAKKINGSLNQIEDIDSFRISAETKQLILELSKQKPLLDQSFKTVTDDIASYAFDLRNFQDELAILRDVPELIDLETAIEKVKREVRIEEELEKLAKQAEKQDAAIKDSINRLPLWTGNRESLLQIEPPMVETVRKFQKDFTMLQEELKRVNESILQEQISIEENNERIRELEALENIPTAEELKHLREHRDHGWVILRSNLHGKEDKNQIITYTNGLPLEQVFEKAIQKADLASDTMRIQAEKVGEKNKRLGDIQTSELKISQHEEKREKLTNELSFLHNEWSDQWQSANIAPLTPEEMLEWLQKYEKIKELTGGLNELILGIQEKEAKRSSLKSLLSAALEKLELPSLEITLTNLLDHAVRSFRELQEKKSKRNQTLQQIRQIEKNVSHKEEEKQTILTRVENWTSQWKQAITKVPVWPGSSPTVVVEIVQLLEECVLAYEKTTEKEKELKAVNESIQKFKELAESLIDKYQLNSIPEHHAISQLHKELIQAQKDQSTAEGIDKQLKGLRETVNGSHREIEAVTLAIENLKELANCKEDEELEQLISMFYLKVEFISKIQEIEEELFNLGGGLTIDQLIKECDGIEYDTISVEISEIENTLQHLDEKRMSFSKDHGALQKEYFEKSKGNSNATVKAEQDKESILSRLQFHAEQYVTHKMAALLLQKGIEHYRNNNQSPILTRAGEIFSRLTLYSYHGITVDYDEKDEPVLMGVRNNGDKVRVDGMSDGATDQLYLALRIASLEKYVHDNEPIPFIVDDILIHFDDERSKETLRVLLELSQKTQVIFFTHHSRLIEIIKQVGNDDYQLEEIANLNPTITV